MRGSRLVDYVVHIGKQICTNSDLQDNQLSCRPPKVKPSSTVNDTIHCGQYLSVTVRQKLQLKVHRPIHVHVISNDKLALALTLTDPHDHEKNYIM